MRTFEEWWIETNEEPDMYPVERKMAERHWNAAKADSAQEGERLRTLLDELCHQVEISGGIDTQGHEMKNLEALKLARAALAAQSGEQS